MGGAAKGGRRVSWDEGMAIAGEVLKWLKPLLKKAEIAGSLRRGKPEVGDVDLVVMAKDRVTGYAEVNAVLGSKFGWQIGDPTKAKHSGLWGGVQIDVAIATKGDWGAKLMFLTGSWQWNVKQRVLAKRKGLKLNEKGLWDEESRVAGATEAELYAALGMKFVEPRDREEENWPK